MKTRKIKKIFHGKPTIEGAGVHLKRAFGYYEASLFDPFLLLDDFHSGKQKDYIAGFPWHPHRGIETITYVLNGAVDHKDSMGNEGRINSGDIQWMTAGSGIIHQEMPKGQQDGLMWGFQLWANLPAAHKMTEPRYREIKSEKIPEITLDNGTKIKVIAGKFNGTTGAVKEILIDPEYLDITIPPDSTFSHDFKVTDTVFAYIIEGSGFFDSEKDALTKDKEIASYSSIGKPCLIKPENVVLFSEGEEICVSTREEKVRFLLVSGKPLREPIAWYGPIVMNTKEELEIAFEEYQKGTFIKNRASGRE